MFALLCCFIIATQSEKGETVLYFSHHRTALANTFFAFWTHAGELYPFVIASVGYLVWQQWRKAGGVALAGLLVLLTSHAAKLFFASPRPFAYFEQLHRASELTDVNGVLSDFLSFPSGHTTAAFAVYTLLALYTVPRLKPYFVLPLLFAATGVAVSRVYLAVHFCEDVLAGSVLGVCIASFCYLAFSLVEPSTSKVEFST